MRVPPRATTFSLDPTRDARPTRPDAPPPDARSTVDLETKLMEIVGLKGQPIVVGRAAGRSIILTDDQAPGPGYRAGRWATERSRAHAGPPGARRRPDRGILPPPPHPQAGAARLG